MTLPSASLIQASHFVRHAIPQARKMVLNVFRNMAKEESRTTHQIYAECHKVKASLPSRFLPLSLQHEQPTYTPLPEYPEHPIRSKGYLKRVILTDLQNRDIIQKIIIKRELRDEEIAEFKERAEKLRRRDKRMRLQGKTPIGIIPTEVSDWQWQLTPRGVELLASTEDVRAITGELETEFDHLDEEQLAKLSMGVEPLEKSDSELVVMKSNRVLRQERQKARREKEMQEAEARQDDPAQHLVDDKCRPAVRERLPHQDGYSGRFSVQTVGLRIRKTEETLPKVPRLYPSTGNSARLDARTILSKPRDESWRLLSPRLKKPNNQDGDSN